MKTRSLNLVMKMIHHLIRKDKSHCLKKLVSKINPLQKLGFLVKVLKNIKLQPGNQIITLTLHQIITLCKKLSLDSKCREEQFQLMVIMNHRWRKKPDKVKDNVWQVPELLDTKRVQLLLPLIPLMLTLIMLREEHLILLLR
jgi:hypothetical protein